MKILWYGLTLICGFIGLTALLRFLELQLRTGSLSPLPLVMGVIFLILAYQSLMKARST